MVPPRRRDVRARRRAVCVPQPHGLRGAPPWRIWASGDSLDPRRFAETNFSAPRGAMYAALVLVVLAAFEAPALGGGAGEATALATREPGDAFPPASYSTFRRPPPRNSVTRIQTDCRLLHLYEINDVQVRGIAPSKRGPVMPLEYSLMLVMRSPRAPHRPRHWCLPPAVDRTWRFVHSIEVRAAKEARPGWKRREQQQRNEADS